MIICQGLTGLIKYKTAPTIDNIIMAVIVHSILNKERYFFSTGFKVTSSAAGSSERLMTELIKNIIKNTYQEG